MTDRKTPPRVPDRSWRDPVLGATLATGAEAREAVARLLYRTEPGELLVAADIETPGLDRAFEINCVTFAWEWPDGSGVQAVLLDPERQERDFQLVFEVIEHARNLVFHNAAFDIPPLYNLGVLGLTDVNKVIDTVLLARMALPTPPGPSGGMPKTLTALATRFLGLSEYSGGMEQAFKAAGYKTHDAGYAGMDIDVPVYRKGAMADTIATLRLEPILREKCVTHLTDHPFTKYGATSAAEALELIHTQETVHRVMMRRSAVGIAVDLEYLDEYRERVDADRYAAGKELAACGLEGGSGKGGKIVEFLESIGELPANWPRTPTRKLKATKDLMETLDHPLGAAQRTMAQTEKVLGYLDKVARQAHYTGRCHPQVGVLGASATGRMSYSMPELQQFPADARPILRADVDAGFTSIDWSQIEPVVMGNMARDIGFLEPYEAGADLYEPIMRACGIDRPMAKVVLLATMYGQGVKSLAARIGHTEESAAQIRRQMLTGTMPLCERWMSRIADIGDNYGRVITAGGRILPIDPGFGYKAVNYVIQGSAYDVLAATICTMEERGLGDHVMLAMHDELVVDTDVAAEVQEIMMTPPEFLSTWAERVPVLRTDRADMGTAWEKV